MTGWIYLLVSLSAIEIVYALGSGPQAYAEMQVWLQNPLVVLFHTFALFAVGYVLVRFIELFPKSQPAPQSASSSWRNRRSSERARG